jgi:hypothetical protein
MPDAGGAGGSEPFDVGSVMAERAAAYVELVERAGRRLLEDDYRSEHLVDDWFTWVGMCLKDTVAVATLGWRSLADQTSANATEDRSADDH